MSNSTIASVATTATIMVSTLVSTADPTKSSAASPTQPSKIENVSDSSAYIYPIICTILGFVFIGCIYLYIYHTRNKSYDTDESRGVNKSSFNNSGNSGRFNTDRQYNNNSEFASSIENAFGITPTDDRFISGMSYPDMEYNNGSKQKKAHYPNPLFAHSRPLDRAQPVMRANGSDVVDEDVNLNILTQEEVQLLRMKKRNNQNKQDGQMFHKNGMAQAPAISPQINSKHANMDVAPFNYVNSESLNSSPTRPEELFKSNSTHSNEYYVNEPTRPNELYNSGLNNSNEYFRGGPMQQNKLYKKDSEEFYYNDSFVRSLGNDIKVETKKVEYVQPEEDLINKIKIKRFNN